MARTVAIGIQDFATIRENNCFYVDKTNFIKEWWESRDMVTLIARPRRFGKTLNMSMLEQFFSLGYKGRGDLFEGLSVWQEEKYRRIQGSWPVMTGITKVSKESIFSDLNHLNVVTSSSDEYAAAFGFTEEEVFAALEEYGLEEKKEKVKLWYDGFTFGRYADIYNPWSIINFLKKKKLEAYWANTSSNSLVSQLIQRGDQKIKESFEVLLQGGSIRCAIDEQIVFNQLTGGGESIWSLLLASGYLNIVNYEEADEEEEPLRELAVTNREVRQMFKGMVRDWFGTVETPYNDFVKALLQGDLDAMNDYMNRVSLEVFSHFDTARQSAKARPERFYHGFVLGLVVNMQKDYVIISNQESGFGRYDVVMEPKKEGGKAFILEFKVHNPRKEQSLEETVEAALLQIEKRQYAAALIQRGISAENIHAYGLAFEGKEVLIGHYSPGRGTD